MGWSTNSMNAFSNNSRASAISAKDSMTTMVSTSFASLTGSKAEWIGFDDGGYMIEESSNIPSPMLDSSPVDLLQPHEGKSLTGSWHPMDPRADLCGTQPSVMTHGGVFYDNSLAGGQSTPFEAARLSGTDSLEQRIRREARQL